MALTEEKKSEKKEKPLTKVIVRRLPPSIDQGTFLTQVSPIPDYNYIYIVNGDLSLGENAFSRVYINFICPEDVFSFKERFDNYVFLDTKGQEYAAVVEFAPFQKIPKKRGKNRIDPKCGTIESDPYYLNFIDSLNKPIENLDEKPEYSLQLNSEDKTEEISTPLLEYIKNKRAQKMKIREVRREEREKKRREFERRKELGKNVDDRKYDERSPVNKNYSTKFLSSKMSSPKQEKHNEKEKRNIDKVDEVAEKDEKPAENAERVFEHSSFRQKDKKFEEKKKEIKPRFPKKDYSDSREYKRSETYKDYKGKDNRPKYDDYKKDDKAFTNKKVKKYSEKREERRLEAQKAEQKKIELAKQSENQELCCDSEKNELKYDEKDDNKHKPNDKEFSDINAYSEISSDKQDKDTKTEKSKKIDCTDKEGKLGEGDHQSSRRIRNKDRPTIAIYRPGMLSKRKQPTDDTKIEDQKKDQKEKD